LLPLAAALGAAGHEVRWATAEESCPRLTDLGFTTTVAGLSARERHGRFGPELADVMALPPRQRRAGMFSGLFARVAAPVMRTDLLPVFASFRPDVVVSETAELAAAPLAASRGVPHVTVAFSGSLPADAMERLLPSLQPLWAAEGLPVPPSAGLVDRLYLHPFPPSFGQTPPDPTVRPMRPELFGGGAVPDAPDWLLSLGVERPAVYVTAGTEAAAAQAPWAATIEAIGSLDVDALVTSGPHVDLSGRPLPPNVRVERFVPQHLVLGRVSVVVSHGGAGTMLAAAAHSIPQLLAPLAADQWENTDAVVGSGAAIACEPDQRTAAFIGAALAGLLHGQTYREAADRVAAEIAAMPSPRDHVPTIEALIG
jgi:UDP:flavonoid glycosyltransferase YjiC (YdhE family)